MKMLKGKRVLTHDVARKVSRSPAFGDSLMPKDKKINYKYNNFKT